MPKGTSKQPSSPAVPCHVSPSSVPLSPSAAVRPPKSDDWLHEPKWDGFRFQIIKDGSKVRLHSRQCAEYTDRLPGMVEPRRLVHARVPSSTHSGLQRSNLDNEKRPELNRAEKRGQQKQDRRIAAPPAGW